MPRESGGKEKGRGANCRAVDKHAVRFGTHIQWGHTRRWESKMLRVPRGSDSGEGTTRDLAA